jgi:hypothetical protein
MPVTGPVDEAQAALEQRESFDPAAWEAALAAKAALPQAPEPRPPELDAEVVERLRDSGAILLPDDRERPGGDVRRAENPEPRGSFGFVGAFAEVRAADEFRSGTLAVAVDPKQLGPVLQETVRLFRWNADDERFRKVEPSGIAGDGSYVWGRIGAPGVYAVIGLHADPLVLHAVKTFCGLGGFMATLEPGRRERLQHDICQLILCAGDLRDALADPGAIEALLTGAFGVGANELPLPLLTGGWEQPELADICERCVGMRVTPLLPECELLPDGPTPTICSDPGWRDVGPADLAGCVIEVIVDPTNSERLYAAAADGGVWRLDSATSYPAVTWTPLTDQQPNLSIGAVAVARSDSRVLYYADALEYVYRSVDRGSSWTRTSPTKIGRPVYRLVVHPSDPDTVYAATSTGVWFTGDGGTSWSTLNAGKITDVVMDPSDSSILYVGKPTVGVLKTYNSGLTWQIVLPWSASSASWPMIKLALGAGGTEATRTVAAKLNEEIWLNRVGGRNGVGPIGWQRMATLSNMGQGDWDHVVGVDPFNSNVIFTGGQTLYRSADGGASWSGVVQAGGGDPTHEDQQSIAFDPNLAGVVYLSNDGGVWRSADGGQTWATGSVATDIAARKNLNRGLVTAQFFRVGATGTRALGNLFHSGIIGSSNLAGRGWAGVEGHGWEWHHVYGDPRRPSYFVLGGALLRRKWPSTGVNDFQIPWGTPSFPPTAGAAVGSIAVDPRPASSTVLVGSHTPGRIMRGDGSAESPTWSAMPGIAIGDEPIVSIDFARSAPGKAYAVSRLGHVFRKDDVNDDVTAPAWSGLGQWTSPTSSEVRQLAVNAQDANRIYLITAEEIVSWTPAAGWSSIKGSGSTALPSSDLHSIVVDPRTASTIYVGADVGVFVSRDNGASWYAFDHDLPNAIVGQIFWDGDYLYATTYGRGLWRRRPCL